jgi:hypothetical protein
MVEALGRRLDHKRRNGNIHGLRIIQGIKRINHSEFVDDILFVTYPTTHRLGYATSSPLLDFFRLLI